VGPISSIGDGCNIYGLDGVKAGELIECRSIGAVVKDGLKFGKRFCRICIICSDAN
jgi:hypothetical protein